MRKGERTRQAIVERVAPLFNRRGFDGTALSEVLRVTGLTKGGIYRHFSSKEELAVAAFEHARRTAADARWKSVDASAHAIDQLRQFVANFTSGARPLPGGCPLLNTVVDADDGNPALRARVRRAIHAWRARLAGIVRLGIERGEVRRAIDPESIATIVIAALEGGVMMSRAEDSQGPLHEVGRHLEAVFESLRASPRRSTRR